MFVSTFRRFLWCVDAAAFQLLSSLCFVCVSVCDSVCGKAVGRCCVGFAERRSGVSPAPAAAARSMLIKKK